MIFARILNGTVQDCIVLDDLTLTPLFSQGYDYFIQTDNLIPQPGVAWGYDGTSFTPPEQD